MPTDRINVLLIVLEGARADHLAAAGYERDTMPFLDQVAREGVRFTHAFSTAASAPSAYASLCTGLFPSLHGVTEEAPVLAASRPVLAELLKMAGYRTAAFCPDPALTPEAGFGRGFDRFYTGRVGGRFTGRAADYARRASDRVLGRRDAGARRTTQALLEWLNAGREPFFAAVHYREPLRPIRPPAPYDRVFMPDIASAAQARTVNQPSGSEMRAVSAEERIALAALHDGALRYADLRVKQIADALIADGRWDDTLVIVTAGHGEDLGDGGALGGLPSLADTALHVPLVLRCPRRIPAGYLVEEFAQPSDLLPTILELTGCAAEVAVQGRALLTASGVTVGPPAIISEAFRSPFSPVRRKVIRNRREKFVWQSDEANVLFDLGADPGERRNLAGDQPERADRLRRALFDWLAESHRWAVAHRVPIAAAESRHMLERQGAID